MNNVSIQKIDLAALQDMESLLSKSMGGPTSMADEIEYFTEENPSSWLFTTDTQNQKIGFVRYFPQNAEWSQAELFVDECVERKSVIRSLLEKFLKNLSFPKGHRLKFEFKALDKDLNTAFDELHADKKKQNFHHFEMVIEAEATPLSSERPEGICADELAKVLSHLHPVTATEAKKWLDNDLIRLQRAGDKIAAAAQVKIYPESAEIVRIATHQDFLRQGHAKSLVESLKSELSVAKVPKIFLKVEDVRTPAIAFYKCIGFQEVTEKKEIWHSLYF